MAARVDKQTTSTSTQSKVTSSDFLTNFNRHPQTAQLSRLTNSEAIKRSVRNLVITQQGERLFQPNIGSNLHRLLFENISPQVTTAIEQYIYEAIINYEPRVRDVVVVASADELNNAYSVIIAFEVINNSNPITLNIVLNRMR